MMRKILFAFCFILISFSANASCKFGIELGDNISEFGDKYGPAEPSLYDGMSFLVVGAEEICPNENLEEIIVEFRFIEDKLSAINLIALNDAENSTSNKLTLMKYVKRVYGQFDSGDNPKAYVGYELYKKPNFFVVYQRMVGEDKIINEEIYISNAEQDKKMSSIYQKWEEEVEKEKNN